MKMEFLCDFNGFSVSVGRKYLTITNIKTGERRKFFMLKEDIAFLEELKEKYQANDAMRVKYVLDHFFSETFCMANNI